MKALLDAGLLRLIGERRNGNFVEQLYQSVASSFMVSPQLACGGDRRVDALRTQVPLEHLVHVGGRIQRDAIELLDRAAFEGEDIHSLAVEAEVRFPDADARAAFMDEYLRLVKQLLRKHGTRKGDGFRVALTVYPEEKS